MNYRNPELLDRLAREYVLGTLRGPARRRFAGLLAGSVTARRSVQYWEQRLVPLALELAPVPPPSRVWDGIATELGFRTAIPWAAIAAGLAALAVGIGLVLANRTPAVRDVVRDVTHEPAAVIVMADKAGKPVWLLNAFPELKELRAHAIAAASVAPQASYELWMLPDNGAAPVSLGLLPEVGDITLILDERRVEVLAVTSTLAVSREPSGGSATGAPTGPVLYTATIVRSGI
ncbi:MAG: anti-sigma factor [Gammaproteobacteria bacterium]